jgi:hypothetical protein
MNMNVNAKSEGRSLRERPLFRKHGGGSWRLEWSSDRTRSPKGNGAPASLETAPLETAGLTRSAPAAPAAPSAPGIA